MKKSAVYLMTGWFLLAAPGLFAQHVVLDTGWYHLRNNGPREWSSFPETADSTRYALTFSAQPNDDEMSLSLRQDDVKLNWQVTLNGKPLGSLVADEKDLRCYLRIPPATLRKTNVLEIFCRESQGDDIRAGEIILHQQSLREVLSEGFLDIAVSDEDGAPVPARLTITNGEGILQTVWSPDSGKLAIRPGFVYTGDGTARMGLPSGTYRVYAGRGFEYSIDSATFIVTRDSHLRHEFSLRREVATPGWVSSDTHIHTFTWSRHGDATVKERALTIAGENIELPVFTDHNLQIDLAPVAREAGVDKYFTPVTGNEVTTAVGHFNVFPLPAHKRPDIDPRVDNWQTLSDRFAALPDTKVIILNHARDIHAGFRPFDAKKHLAIAGTRLDGWTFPANAMEIINSGAQQTDPMELTRDWFGMLNGGHIITPAGSSDSHDVSRYFVGQARTYIRCRDDDAENIDVQEAVKNFMQGNVMVSFGLMAAIEVNDTYGPGEIVPSTHEVKVSVNVSGPAWTTATRVSLYANGKKIRQEEIRNGETAGSKWSGSWNLMMPAHDVFLVAVAEGPDPARPFWPIAKPYQHVSREWSGAVFGVSGAVWLDGDGNGKRTAAASYARVLYDQANNDADALIRSLAPYDESVAIEVAALLLKNRKSLTEEEIADALQRAAPEIRAVFESVTGSQ